MADNDRLEQTLKRLAQETQRKERELEELRRKLKVLDDARALIMQEESHIGSASHAIPAPVPPKSFAEAVLRGIEEQPPSETGFSAVEIARAVRAMGFATGATSNNSYNASVYVTLMRLAKKGDIRVIQSEAGRRFAKADPSGVLFDAAVEAN
jgi:chromatin segregation and condensation protein Rec8/ScpA/Scc1 (kleisin family)